MPPALIDAAPFSTTRAEGTGLGLTIARAAVLQHGGTLTFTARAPTGTIAVMNLPAEPGGALAGAS